jgi:hypothetical protein
MTSMSSTLALQYPAIQECMDALTTNLPGYFSYHMADCVYCILYGITYLYLR